MGDYTLNSLFLQGINIALDWLYFGCARLAARIQNKANPEQPF